MSAEPVYGVTTAADADADERFEVLFRRYYNRVRGLGARRFPSCDPDDLAQETMVRVLLHAHRLDPQRDPWPYIAAITVNVGRDLSRTKVAEVVLTEETYEREVSPAADEPVLAAARDEAVQNVLRELAPASRQVLALQAFEEMSVGEIARFLGSNDNAVRQKLFRARRQFRRALASVPSGAFGIAAFARRMRRRISATNVLQGSGLSLSGAAAIAVAVVGAVSVGVVPSHHGDVVAAPGESVVTRLGAEVVNVPDRPEHAATRRATPAAAASTAVAPRRSTPTRVEVRPVEVAVHQNNLFKPGETNHARVQIDTPWGPVGIGDSGSNSPGHSNLCPLIERAC